MKQRYSLALVALMAGAPCALAQSYDFVQLGTLGGTFGTGATDVNNNNEVVGFSDTPESVYHAFYYDGTTMTDLGVLPGHEQSIAYAINDSGVIVGYSVDANGVERAVKWERDGQGAWQITDLGTLAGTGWSIAYGISNTGVIVGASTTSTLVYHGFVLQNGVMADLGAPGFFPETGSYSEALGVNDAGHAVGYAYKPLGGPDHAFYFDGTKASDITPAGQFIFARGTGLNNMDVASGILIQPGGGSDGFEAATWSATKGWTELGVLPGTTESEAWAINDDGVVVGRSFDIALMDYRGFAYIGGAMVDLSTLPGVPHPITEAVAVNSAGRIIANADTMEGPRAFVLIPQGECYANCDGSTSSPVLNVSDFGCFLTKFAAGDAYANCDGSTGSPILNVADFGCFLTKFAAGCE